jgi:hypothetical protein
MRTIERTSQFKRDYKREAKGAHRKTLEIDFIDIVSALANDQPLAEKHRDRAPRVRYPWVTSYPDKVRAAATVHASPPIQRQARRMPSADYSVRVPIKFSKGISGAQPGSVCALQNFS